MSPVSCRPLWCLALLWWSTGVVAADITATEKRWLQGIWPVVAFARSERLPIDIVVQPQPTPGHAPLSLGFVAGRCKLVLSMRDNRAAETTLTEIEPELLDTTLELMAAHELGHCRRYLDGTWYGPPAGFVAPGVQPEVDNATAARREEAYGDLVGLAWVQRHHPARYAAVHAWLVRERVADRAPGSAHDTLDWVNRATTGVGSPGDSIFMAAHRLWRDSFEVTAAGHPARGR